MKYCVPYYKDFRYNDVVDEILIPYKNLDMDIISNFKQEQKIIIEITNIAVDYQEVMLNLRMCKSIHNNLSVSLYLKLVPGLSELISPLKECGIPFIYSYVTSPAELYDAVRLGASEVYITETEGFNLIKDSEFCKNHNVKIRIFPNVCQKPRTITPMRDYCSFFVRPEDTTLYEPYVDTFELYGDVHKTSVAFEIYKNQQWAGDLNNLIVGLRNPFPNKGIVPYFGQVRSACQQRCLRDECDFCTQIASTAQSILKESPLEIKTEKKGDWIYESESHKKALQLAEGTLEDISEKISKRQGIQEDNQ